MRQAPAPVVLGLDGAAASAGTFPDLKSGHPLKGHFSMESLTRRNALRLAGGGAAGVTGALGTGMIVPANAAGLRVRLKLESVSVPIGGTVTLRVVANPNDVRSIAVSDSLGMGWNRIIDGLWRELWTATATSSGTSTITVVSTGFNGEQQRDVVTVQVGGGTPPESPDTHTGGPLIGMSAQSNLWSRRIGEVGAGVSSRRIFADLNDGPLAQIRLVEQAHNAKMLPVISYKVGGDIARAASGGFNAIAQQAAAKLASYNKPTAVAVWHEPNSDLSPAQYAAISRQLLPIFKRGQVKVGPILNGFLLDRQEQAFGAFCPDELFRIWQWFGIDTYEGGTFSNPGPAKPAGRIPALRQYIRSRGYDLPLGIGEYNGYSATTINAVGEAMFTTPNVWFGCMWNSEGERAKELSGERLTAFRQTLNDPRAGRV